MAFTQRFLFTLAALVVLPLFLFLLSPALMVSASSIARVPSQNVGKSIMGKSTTIAFPANVTAGNTVIVAVAAYQGSGSPTVTKSSGTAVVGAPIKDKEYISGVFEISLWRIPVTSSGSLTIAAARTNASYMFIALNEYWGMSAAPVDVTDQKTGTSNTESTNALGVTGADAVVMLSLEDSTANFTYTQSGTNIFNESHGASIFTAEAQDKITTGAGSTTLTAGTGSNSWPWFSIAVAYKAAASGPADTQAPSVPAGLSATAASTTILNLSWSPSADNVGVAGYKVFRNAVQIATTTTTSFSNIGLAASTTYSYAVSAFDATGNVSALSATASATTFALPPPPPPPDTQAPTAPATLGTNTVSQSQLDLSWSASTDNVGVTGYKIFRNGALIATSTASSYSDTGLTASTTYSYTVSAYDAAGNESAQSSSALGTTLAASQNNGSYTTNFPLTENPISEGGKWIGGQSAGGNQWGDVKTVAGIASGVTEPTYFGDPTAILTGTWSPDQTATGVVRVTGTPGGMFDEVEVRLRFTIAPNSITGYEIYCSVLSAEHYCQIARWNGPIGSFCNIQTNRPELLLVDGDVLTGTVTGTNPVTITGYLNGKQVIQATDTGVGCDTGGAAGPWTTGNPGFGFFSPDNYWNTFGFSSFTATGAFTGPDTAAPSIPTTLSAAGISQSQIKLAWSPSADNVGVTGYKIFRNGALIATSTASSYSDTGLTASTTYSYTVSAYDAAGNESAQSSSALGTTLASGVTAPIILGNSTNINGSDNSGDANLEISNMATLTQTGTIQSMSFYVSQPSGQLRLGIYDATGASGGPGVLKAQTASFTPVAGWNTQPVVTPVSLTPGTYWLAYLDNSNNLHYPTDFSTGTFKGGTRTFGTLPGTFPSLTVQSRGLWGFYATLK